jgi:hypothetical protein
MRAALVGGAVFVGALITISCGGNTLTSATQQGISLIALRPSSGTVSLAPGDYWNCHGCTASLNAQFSVLSEEPLQAVNLRFEGYDGQRRCLSGVHDVPDPNFSVAAGQPTAVTVFTNRIECTAPFQIDRVEAHVTAGDARVFDGRWSAALRLVD